MIPSKTLVLLTQKFPFESGEEFLAIELKTLEQAFDQIIIIPTAVRDFSQPRSIGKNTLVRIIRNPETAQQIVTALLSKFFQTLFLIGCELRKSKWNLKHLKYYFYHIPYALYLKSKISKELKTAGDYVLYSYWMDTNAFAAALLRKETPEMKLVVRSHGGDLYNERWESGSIAFRETVYEAAESLVFISEHGKSYASTHYPKYSSKMKLFRLGVEDYGSSPTTNFPNIFQIVSCSSLIPLKRVKLIAEVLNQCSAPICWTHFGGEKTAVDALQKSLPNLRNKFEIVWKGKVKNEQVHSFYAAHHVDLLINLSSSEGIPVSIMEAISFGIPVFANAVGGIPEIVQEKTGVLILDGLSIKQIAALLDQFLKAGATRNEVFRNGVRFFWSQHYSAVQNHGLMVEHLLGNTFTITKEFA